MDECHTRNPWLGDAMLPVEVVFAPEWWHKHAGVCFDRDFFFHPARRVEEERRMERVLHEKWGRFGLGSAKGEIRPEVGAVHLAAGYMISQMLGCEVRYHEDHPPQIVPRNAETLIVEPERAFDSQVSRDFQNLVELLRARYGRVCGDVNWSGILNIALDLRGQDVFVDMYTHPEDVQQNFHRIAQIIERFVTAVENSTGTSSISVNRNVRHFARPVFLHSECSHTMISEAFYERFLMPLDVAWSRCHRPFGIHYCGPDPHRYAQTFAKLPCLDFLDVGWGGDVARLRQFLPNTFLNLRLSPVEIVRQTTDEIRATIVRLVSESGNPYLTGVCCINMDDAVTDDKVAAIFETVAELRRSFVVCP
ncbi:MAG: hypothetical protein JW955_15145 [Sedimentisphaerales bacterium]|nr:hypothetical protein [Sedimentisphaerales bacterium]